MGIDEKNDPMKLHIDRVKSSWVASIVDPLAKKSFMNEMLVIKISTKC